MGRPSPLPQLQGHLHNVDLEQLLRIGHEELFKVFGLRLNKGHKTAILGAAHPSGAGTGNDFTAPWPGLFEGQTRPLTPEVEINRLITPFQPQFILPDRN